MTRLRLPAVALALLIATAARADLRTFDVDPQYQQEVFAALTDVLTPDPQQGLIMEAHGRVELLPSGQILVNADAATLEQVERVLQAIRSRPAEAAPRATLRYWAVLGAPEADSASSIGTAPAPALDDASGGHWPPWESKVDSQEAPPATVPWTAPARSPPPAPPPAPPEPAVAWLPPPAAPYFPPLASRPPTPGPIGMGTVVTRPRRVSAVTVFLVSFLAVTVLLGAGVAFQLGWLERDAAGPAQPSPSEREPDRAAVEQRRGLRGDVHDPRAAADGEADPVGDRGVVAVSLVVRDPHRQDPRVRRGEEHHARDEVAVADRAVRVALAVVVEPVPEVIRVAVAVERVIARNDPVREHRVGDVEPRDLGSPPLGVQPATVEAGAAAPVQGAQPLDAEYLPEEPEPGELLVDHRLRVVVDGHTLRAEGSRVEDVVADWGLRGHVSPFESGCPF